MNREDTERKAFLNYIAAGTWDDEARRHIYADWLDERGEYEEAERQRKWVASARWLHELAARSGTHCEKYYEGYDAYREETRGLEWDNPEHQHRRIAAHYRLEKAKGERPVTFDDLVQAGKDYVESEGRELFTQMGDETLRDELRGELLDDYWKHWEVVTGLRRFWPKKDEDYTDGSPFSCSC